MPATISGGAKLEAALRQISAKVKTGAVLKVGFLSRSRYPDGKSVAMIAAIQNFGAPSRGIPPRPFFTKMVKKESGGWPKLIAGQLVANDYDVVTTMTQVGYVLQGQLRLSIQELVDPPLSPVSLLLRERFWGKPYDVKFSDVMQARLDVAAGIVSDVSGTQAKPLIWTSHMIGSVDSQVDKL